MAVLVGGAVGSTLLTADVAACGVVGVRLEGRPLRLERASHVDEQIVKTHLEDLSSALADLVGGRIIEVTAARVDEPDDGQPHLIAR